MKGYSNSEPVAVKGSPTAADAVIRASVEGAKAAVQRRSAHPKGPHDNWRKPVTANSPEDAALRLGVEYCRTAAALLQYLFWPFLGRPADAEAGKRVTRLTRKRPPQMSHAVS